MKKLTCMGLSLALMAGLLAGCGSNGTTSTPTSTPAASSTPVQSQTTTLSGTVNTDGSTSMGAWSRPWLRLLWSRTPM